MDVTSLLMFTTIVPRLRVGIRHYHAAWERESEPNLNPPDITEPLCSAEQFSTRQQKRNKTWHSCPEKWHIGAPWYA
ncbi:hypothetical protein ALP98_102277 [Pseudomonas viridiflava]|uniref:Uncharacterized protein n=2 Tax=Pseudomonas syringae group TaxID=136849 RepID=A0A3M4PA47_PSEVI|nr:hypothetical protein ALQ30_101730 [Pseudomonas syringae pv. persicae]RMQ10400.1 hypothetical protein ALQ09_101551 [Pseudomonas viridiflava]RMQ75075.1 hypothetical protein ALP98_102277 [Pseudomonas viridiflava]